MEDDNDEVTDEEADRIINELEFGGNEGGGQKVVQKQTNESVDTFDKLYLIVI